MPDPGQKHIVQYVVFAGIHQQRKGYISHNECKRLEFKNNLSNYKKEHVVLTKVFMQVNYDHFINDQFSKNHAKVK